MRKGLLALLGVMAVGTVSAITIQWDWNSNGAGNWESNSAMYLVYSNSQLTSGTQAVTAVNNSGKDGVGQGYGHTPGAAGDTAGSSFQSAVASGTQVIAGPSTNFASPGYANNVGFGSQTLQSGYYYLVIFNNSAVDQATQYRVAQAGAVGAQIGAGEQLTNGYLEVGGDHWVGPSGEPLSVLFIDPTWMWGTYWHPAPEPTALALLALGVAGVALRRRVR